MAPMNPDKVDVGAEPPDTTGYGRQWRLLGRLQLAVAGGQLLGGTRVRRPFAAKAATELASVTRYGPNYSLASASARSRAKGPTR